MRAGERDRRRAHVGGVLVVHHRALAARVVDQALGEPQLEHALARGRVLGGVGERVPGAEPHADRVASWSSRAVCRHASASTSAAPIRRRSAGPAAMRSASRRAGRRRLARRDLHRSAVRHRHACSAAAATAYADRADDPDAFVAWLAAVPRAQPPRARADTARCSSTSITAPCTTSRSRSTGCSGARRFVNEIVWCYAVGGKSRRGFGRKHDTILWYARGDDWAFYPDAVRVPRRGGSHMRLVGGVPGEDRPQDRPRLSLPGRRRQGPRGLVDRHRDAQPLRPRAHRLAVAEARAAGRAGARGGDAARRPGRATGSPARARPRRSRSGSGGGSSRSIASRRRSPSRPSGCIAQGARSRHRAPPPPLEIIVERRRIRIAQRLRATGAAG